MQTKMSSLPDTDANNGDGSSIVVIEGAASDVSSEHNISTTPSRSRANNPLTAAIIKQISYVKVEFMDALARLEAEARRAREEAVLSREAAARREDLLREDVRVVLEEAARREDLLREEARVIREEAANREKSLREVIQKLLDQYSVKPSDKPQH
jgi:hypothetical protein